jgi:hypothetical protein
MKLTREAVDIFRPKHGRTSCDDNNLCNGYGGWTGKYDPDTGRKVIRYPRCNRCYLLEHVGEEIETLDFKPEMTLEYQGN